MRWKERETFDILERVLQGTPYRVFSKVRLSDVLGVEPGERIPSEDYKFLLTAHLDFVVYCRRGYLQPIFAIEFDGPHHQEPSYIKRDIKKNRLCMRANLPLLRIGYVELEKNERITLLEFMLQRFTFWQKERKQILANIQAYINSLELKEFGSLTKNIILDSSVDPHFIFNIKHKFPGIIRVSNRLLTRFGIETPYFKAKKNIHNHSYLYCAILPYGEDGFNSSHRVIKRMSYTLYRHNPCIKKLHWEGGKLRTPGVEVLHEGIVEFSMQWTLPIVEDYDPKEPAIEYFLRTGKLPYAFSEIPGVHIPYITEWFSGYLALREVEKWAKLHLSTTVKKT